VGKTGLVVGIDHIDELVQGGVQNINRDPVAAPLLASGQLKMVVGDGRNGHAALGPYDAIHVGAAAPQIPQPVILRSSLHIAFNSLFTSDTACYVENRKTEPTLKNPKRLFFQPNDFQFFKKKKKCFSSF